jgi:small GTP-binding protein
LEYNINNPSSSSSSSPPAPVQQNPAAAGKNSAKSPKPEEQKHMKLSLWDTAGQETYKSITRSYFRGASGALLVFDISRRNTFASVTAWLHDLRQIAEDDIVVVLVGNKSDLARDKRQVQVEEAEEWCKVNRVMRYVETSAKSGENVERAFLEVAERIYQVCARLVDACGRLWGRLS